MFFWTNPPAEAQLLSLFPSNSISPPHSVLDLLNASQVDWDLVYSRAREAPLELRHRDAERNHTPLFLAIQRDAPPFVIETLLRGYPEAAAQQQRLGLSALHLAVARGLPAESIRYILAAWPEACSKRMNDGCTPLHFVRNVETAKLLIDACPSALGITNNASYLPLHRVSYARYASAELLQLIIDAEDSNGNNTQQQLSAKTFHGATALEEAAEMVERDILNEQPVCPVKWKKLEILARATYRRQEQRRASATSQDFRTTSNTADNNFCLLHALLHMKNPSFQIIQYTVRRHYQQQFQIDHLGRSALTMAASQRQVSTEILQLLLCDPATRSMAGKADATGRWPLHHAAASGRSFDAGLVALWKAAPLALTTADPQTGLYPVLLAACGPDKDDRLNAFFCEGKRLNALFCLLRETPWMVPRTSRRKRNQFHGLLTRDRNRMLLVWFVLPLVVALVWRAWLQR